MDDEYWVVSGDEALVQPAEALGVDAQSARGRSAAGGSAARSGAVDRWSQASWFVTGESGQVGQVRNPADAALRELPLRQVWFDHLLVLSRVGDGPAGLGVPDSCGHLLRYGPCRIGDFSARYLAASGRDGAGRSVPG